METKLIKYGVSLAAFLVMAMLIWPFNTVPTGYRGVVTQFGKITGVEGEGLTLLPPWQRMHVFNTRAEQADIEKAEGSTSDQQPVHVSLTVRYSIATDKVAEVFERYSRNGDLSSYVQTATAEVFKAVTARYTAPDLISQRAKVSADITAALQVKLGTYGANVINIDMRNFAFSDSYMRAINDKVTQEQLKLGADNALLTAKSVEEKKVVIATAEANSIKAKADGDAYALLTNAKAQAEALRVQNNALAQNKDVLELRRIEVDMKRAEQWDGKLPVNIYGSAPIPFLGLSK